MGRWPRPLGLMRWKSKDDVCGDQVGNGQRTGRSWRRAESTRGRRPMSGLSGEVYVMLQPLGRERMSLWSSMPLTECTTNPCLYLRQVSCASNPPLLPTLHVPEVQQGHLGPCGKVVLSLAIPPLSIQQYLLAKGRLEVSRSWSL